MIIIIWGNLQKLTMKKNKTCKTLNAIVATCPLKIHFRMLCPNYLECEIKTGYTRKDKNRKR